MGLAICLIMWFHSIYDVQNAALALVKNMCDIGVDMFMFLSGFSMAYSFQKNSNVRQFYRKRLIRILPAYFLVFIFVYLYRDMIKGNGDILDVLYDLFFLNFFIDTSLIKLHCQSGLAVFSFHCISHYIGLFGSYIYK